MDKKVDFEKLGKIMNWERFDGETWTDVFMREVGDITTVPIILSSTSSMKATWSDGR